MAAGLKVSDGSTWKPWATINQNLADYPSLKTLQRSLIGKVFSPMVWRPAGTFYLFCWIDHWRKSGAAYQPVWGLKYYQQTLNKPVAGEAAYRCVTSGDKFVYKDDAGALKYFDVIPPLDVQHRYFLNANDTINSTALNRVSLGRYPDSVFGGGSFFGTNQVQEYRYDSNWVAAFPNTTDWMLTGYVHPSGTALTTLDLRGDVSPVTGQYKPKPTTVEEHFFIG